MSSAANMSNNNLKRRRPFGHEDAAAEPVLQYTSQFPPPAPPTFDVASLPFELRHHVVQTAAYYGLHPQRLHEIILQERLHQDPRKRQRIAPEISIPSTYPSEYAGNMTQVDLEDKAPSSHRSGPGSTLSQAYESFKNLSVCQQCFRSYDPHDGYQAVPNPADYSYDSNKPYTAEKAPSVPVTGVDSYVTPSIPQNQGTAFDCDDGALMSQYMGGYQPVQVAHSMTPSAAREPLVYHTSSSGNGYFDASGRGVAAASGVSRTSYVPDHVMPSLPSSNPFGNDMSLPMGGPQPLHRPGTLPDATSSGYGAMNGYGHEPVHDEISHQHGVLPQAPHPRGLDVVFPNQKRPPARRGPFQDPLHREQTAQTRRIGSCIRCRMQRIRCKLNPSDEAGPCETCTKLANKSMRMPCIRRKITDVKLFKPGQVQGYEWTRRWEDSIVDNIAHWASSEDKIIQVSEGYTTRFVELRVRRFVPQEGDKLERSWFHEGVRKSVRVPPYAIVDLEAAQRAYTDYINRGIVECFDEVLGSKDSLLWRTYNLAWNCAQDQSVPQDERGLLVLALRLWMAVRLTTRSASIVGKETLGMARNIMDETSPNSGCIPLPPVMGAQLDMILIHQIQSKFRREMLDKLQKMTQSNKQKTWLTTYLVSFILLHNIALITEHDAGYARKHGIKRRFAREKDVEEYHMGANILLAYFHYCNKGIYPFSPECREQELRALAELDDPSVQFVRETRSYAADHKAEWEELRRASEYEKDFFFVSQLFEENWQPPRGM